LTEQDGFQDVFYYNLEQLKNNNHEIIGNEITNILNDLIESKTITKGNLSTIIDNDVIKKRLKEIDSQSLGLNHFDSITFPAYLEKLISDKFTASNIIAKHVNVAITNIISQYNFSITSEQTKKLEEVCFQVALGPGKGVTIPLEFKKKLIESFEDFNLLTTETKVPNENVEEQALPAGDFIQLKDHLEMEFKKIDEETKQINELPKLLVEKAETLNFTKNNDQILNNLFTELNKLPSLKEKKLEHGVVAYILGIIFMDMSSIHALGYHVGGDNVAFARFRLLGAYWLSKSICLSENKWKDTEKVAIGKEIKQAVLEVECSGQIINKLYGAFCKKELKNISKNISQILQSKV